MYVFRANPQRFFIVVAALQQIAFAVKPPNYIEKPPDKVRSFKLFFFFFHHSSLASGHYRDY
jgi:hypothetical protein